MILCNLHYAICGAKILIIADICKGLCEIMQKKVAELPPFEDNCVFFTRFGGTRTTLLGCF